MWQIEVSENTSDEDIEKELLEQVDFNDIRQSVSKLKGIVEKYGPFNEIQVKNENSRGGDLVRTYHEKRGWICDALESIDSRRVWTNFHDVINDYSYLSSGYVFVAPTDRPSRHLIQSWFVSEKPCEESELMVDIEFMISMFFTDSDDDSGCYFRLNLWDLIEADNLSDIDIIRMMSS